MVRLICRLGAVAIAAKVGRHDRLGLREIRRDEPPTDVRQRRAMEQ